MMRKQVGTVEGYTPVKYLMSFMLRNLLFLEGEMFFTLIGGRWFNLSSGAL